MVLPHSVPFEHVGGEHSMDDLAGGAGATEVKAPDSLTLDHAASHLAVAMTIAILLRSIPHHATKRISVIPTEIGASSSSLALTERVLTRAFSQRQDMA